MLVTSKGWQTLSGRGGQHNFIHSDIIPLCDSNISLRHVCLAYQASLDPEMIHATPVYMQSALSHYFNDLNTPEKLDLDETLATGVLLCSVSVSFGVAHGQKTWLMEADKLPVHLDTSVGGITRSSSTQRPPTQNSTASPHKSPHRGDWTARHSMFYIKQDHCVPQPVEVTCRSEQAIRR